jgi:phosphopantothenoylcysteine decarboxylase/phosphopantothenate--cysteine ligase
MAPSMSIPLLKDRRLLLGVTGSIAAFKSAELASRLTQAGAQVDVVLTEAAERFVSPLTFQSLTGRRAYTEADLWGADGHVLHVTLTQAAHLLVIAPASANTLAKMAHGQSDNLLTIIALAARCPLVIAPAMDAGMYEHPATQANLETLHQWGAMIAGPTQGRMASGLVGWGRMLEPDEMVGYVRLALGLQGPLQGRTVVVTAGGTQEPIDPVRAIVNRSSGKQGFALAQAAIDRGADVTLITGPAQLETPVGARRVDVRTAEEMCGAVLAEVPQADVLLMAAAVADFRPVQVASRKIKKSESLPALQLEPTEDILSSVTKARKRNGNPQVVVGFAAESQDLLEGARAKLHAKGLSLIVANDIAAAVADIVLARVVALLGSTHSPLTS